MDMEAKAMNAFVKDIAFLAEKLSQKSPEEVNANVVYEYLDLLKAEAERLFEDKIYASDNSILYTSGDINFDKTEKTL